MTLKGKTTHFNVKFLKGYGFSVSVKDSKIVLKNDSMSLNPEFFAERFELNDDFHA